MVIMNIKKCVLSLIITSSIVLSMTGCSNSQKDVKIETNPISTVDSTEKDNKENYNEFSFMNSKVTIPFKLKDLKNITIDEDICFETDEKCLFSQVGCEDCRIGTLMLENCTVDEKNKGDKNVVYLKISPDLMFDDFEFDYMGLTFNSTKEDIINTLGESEVENQLTYMIDEKTKISFKISDNIIYRVTIKNVDYDEE